MAQRIGQKTVNTFVKGLITEAGEMTFPEGASTDELNCRLNRDGSRSRRLGFNIEDNGEFDYTVYTIGSDDVYSTTVWHNVGGQAGVDWLVLQYGKTLRFYSLGSEPFSRGTLNQDRIDHTVNLDNFKKGAEHSLSEVKVSTTSINGSLVVTSSELNPFVLEYTHETDTLTATQINIKVRDFDWQGDTDTYFVSTTTPSLARHYDTLNAGWADDNNGRTGTALEYYIANDGGNYPALTHPWFAGKNATNEQSVPEWKKIGAGTTLTGNGRFVLDFFNKDRSAVSGIVGIAPEVETTRFKSVASFSGRVFYAGLTSAKNSGKLLFSKLVNTNSELGKCYQQNDPTAEDYNDLLDTDGGVILIPDATNIQYLHTIGPMLLVFAENGVWSVSGVDGVFRATEFSVQKITSVGIVNPQSFVDVEGVPIWWSKSGIHTLTFEAGTGRPSEENLTISTIQTFYDSIDSLSKARCHGVYDAQNKRVVWIYPENGEPDVNKKNRVLILDIALQAFYPWKVSDSQTGDNRRIVGLTYAQGAGSAMVNSLVELPIGLFEPVVAADETDFVYIPKVTQLAESKSSVVFVVASDIGLSFGLFNDKSFYDWGDANYTSFAETGYDFMGDLVLKKSAPYLVTYCRVTEEGWDDEAIIRPSSLYVSAYWDFRKTSSTSAQQAYRYKKTPVPTGNPLDFGYPDTVISTRLKVRGTGRSMRIKFESEEGKDFTLIGYGILQGANNRF